MQYRFAYILAIWFGCGRFPKMPGTAGTLGAVPFYLLLAQGGPMAVAVGAVIVTLVGVWAATEVVRKTGIKDPQIVCIDEVAGVLITLVAAPNTEPEFRALLHGRKVSYLTSIPAQKLELYWVK